MTQHVEVVGFDWRGIQRDARVDAIDTAPLLLEGEHVAWTSCQFGLTDGVSCAHRVGERVFDQQFTLCGERIPPAIRLMPLSLRMLMSLGRCKYCEAALPSDKDCAT